MLASMGRLHKKILSRYNLQRLKLKTKLLFYYILILTIIPLTCIGFLLVREKFMSSLMEGAIKG